MLRCCGLVRVVVVLAVSVGGVVPMVSGQMVGEVLALDDNLVFTGLANTDGPDAVPRAACVGQTLVYGQAKATGLNAINLNNATSAASGGQWFEAPGEVSITGATFYAYVTVAATTVVADVSVYLAGADKLPTGAALATESITITNEIGGATLAELLQQVTFASPVMVSAPYVITVSNNSATGLGVISNDYTVGDGAMEWLSSAEIAGTWLISSDINIGGSPFDADWLFEPTVNYQHVPAFTVAPGCLTAPDSVAFTNTSTFAQSRFYNFDVFAGTPEQSFAWDFGDGSPPELAVSPTHAYATAGPFVVTLTAAINGWSGTCVDTSTVNVGELPASVFGWSNTNLVVDFTDMSDRADSWLWDFGDGNTSTVQSPSHTYASPGVYTVCLTTANACGPDTGCDAVGPVPVELMTLSVE